MAASLRQGIVSGRFRPGEFLPSVRKLTAERGLAHKTVYRALRKLAAEGKGRLLIADEASNRVLVLDEKDGKCLGEIATDKPVRISCAERTGALYVLAREGRGYALRRFSPGAGSGPGGWKALKPEAVMPLREAGFLSVDESANPTVLWIGGGYGATLRIEDPGTGPKFGASREFPSSTPGKSGRRRDRADQTPISNVQVDRLRKEIYFRNGINGIFEGRFCEKTGKTEMVELQYPGFMQGGGTGLQVAPALDGNLYGLGWPVHLFQFDRNGKKVSWNEPTYADPRWAKKVEEFRKKGTEHGAPGQGEAYVPVSMSMMPAHAGGALERRAPVRPSPAHRL